MRVFVLTILAVVVLFPGALTADEVDDYNLAHSPYIHILLMGATGNGYRSLAKDLALSEDDIPKFAALQKQWREKMSEIEEQTKFRPPKGSRTMTSRESKAAAKWVAAEKRAKRQWLGPKFCQLLAPHQRRRAVQFVYILRGDAILTDSALHDALGLTTEQRGKARAYLADIRKQTVTVEKQNVFGGTSTLFNPDLEFKLRPLFAKTFAENELTDPQKAALKRFAALGE